MAKETRAQNVSNPRSPNDHRPFSLLPSPSIFSPLSSRINHTLLIPLFTPLVTPLENPSLSSLPSPLPPSSLSGRGSAPSHPQCRGIRGFGGTRCSVGHGELGMIVYLHIARCTGTT